MSVVVGYAPSDQGRAALRAALREARALRLPLVVAAHAHLGQAGAHDAASEEEVRAELVAAGAAGEQDPPGGIRVHRSRDADVGQFLLDVAEQEGARLVVIGLRRKSPIGKLNLGAAARRVVLAAPCPVLAVKEDASA